MAAKNLPNDEVAIKVVDLNKTFKLPHEKQASIKSSLINFRKRGYEKQVALKDISFEVKKGEFFGIVGRNGSGKSTLLKLISEIYAPDSGTVQVNGKLVPFIELGVGFNPELSGRDNVFLNGALLGFSRKEMENMYDEIVEFAEIERFMDQKLKNYSSGMQVRLAFSIAIRAESDILVLDEVLAVGDAAFQKKCEDYFKQVKKQKKTIILVTHEMSNVEKYCDRAMLIDNSVIKDIGVPNDISKQYTLDNMNVETGNKTKSHTMSNEDGSNRKLSKHVKSLKIKPISKQLIKRTDDLKFEVEYEVNSDIEVVIGMSLLHQDMSIIESNTKHIKLDQTPNKPHRLTYSYPLNLLNPGRYDVSVAIFKKEGFTLIGFDTSSFSFLIDGKESGGILSKRGEWAAVK